MMAAQSAPAPAPLRVLLVGSREEDFFLIREILQRTRATLAADLEHAHFLEEAKVMLQQNKFSLVLFEHETSDVATLQLLGQFLNDGAPIPLIVLTDTADEKEV